jgi:nucleotide-binding universal stress UspA family protein
MPSPKTHQADEPRSSVAARDQEPQIATEPPILVAIDFTEASALALARAFAIASRLGSSIHVVTVARSNGDRIEMDSPERQSVVLSEKDAIRLLTSYVQERLDRYQARFGPARFGVAMCHIRLGDPAHEVAQLASDLEAEMTVVGTHGRSGIRRLVLGSVAEKIVRLAPCPVFVVRPHDHEQPEVRIEPPCPRCVESRRASGGRQMWCAQHRERHGRPHTYSYVDRNTAYHENASLLIPIDPMATHR